MENERFDDPSKGLCKEIKEPDDEHAGDDKGEEGDETCKEVLFHEETSFD